MQTHTLTKSLVDKVKTRWLDLWHQKLADGADAHCQMWYQAIMEVLERAGFDLVSAELRAEEESIRLAGLDEDYIDALVEVTGATVAEPMLLVTSSAYQRAKACRIVRAYQQETKETSQ